MLKLVGERLDRAGIPYMVSGSMAMNYYAQPRMTRDIDLIDAVGTLDWAYVDRWAADPGGDGSPAGGASMIDTPPAVLAMYRRWLLARSGEERLKMGSEMFDAGEAPARLSLRGAGFVFSTASRAGALPFKVAALFRRILRCSRRQPRLSRTAVPVL